MKPANQYEYAESFYQYADILRALIRRTDTKELSLTYEELIAATSDPDFTVLRLNIEDDITLSVTSISEGLEKGVLYINDETISET